MVGRVPLLPAVQAVGTRAPRLQPLGRHGHAGATGDTSLGSSSKIELRAASGLVCRSWSVACSLPLTTTRQARLKETGRASWWKSTRHVTSARQGTTSVFPRGGPVTPAPRCALQSLQHTTAFFLFATQVRIKEYLVALICTALISKKFEHSLEWLLVIPTSSSCALLKPFTHRITRLSVFSLFTCRNSFCVLGTGPGACV